MQEKIKSEGKCLFCGKTFAKAGVNRHLATHLKEKATDGNPGTSFLVKVEPDKSWGTTLYFLSLWIDGETTMDTFDSFLRAIWLECCGHASAFQDPKRSGSGGGMWDIMDAYELLDKGNEEEYNRIMEDCTGQIPMSTEVKDALYKGLALDYEYDFGSTTSLTITAMEQYPMKAVQDIVLLSRNEPLQIMCSGCGKVPATQICTVCAWDGGGVFCNKCAKKHAKECEDFADYASMPVVNSPRMGVCAYEGGTIDNERDGVYKIT